MTSYPGTLDATPASALSLFGQGTGPVYLDEVDCAGNESYLINCSHAGVGRSNCKNSEDAGVKCSISESVSCACFSAL